MTNDFGDGEIHYYFGLSYANYLVLPRTVLQSMPHDWQAKFVEMLKQIPYVIDEEWSPEGGYRVIALTENGRFAKDPYGDYERGRRRLRTKGKP